MDYKFWGVLFIISLLSITPGYALNTSISCIDNSTLREIISVNRVNTTNTSQVYNTSSYILDTTCEFGCDTTNKICAVNPFYENLAVLIIIIIVGLILFKWLL